MTLKRAFDRKMNLKYWENQASRFQNHQVSWWDVNIKKIEIANIIPYLNKKDFVLDIGCSNGASTEDIYKAVKCRIDGIDYSKKSIAQAQKLKIKDLKFEFADILTFTPSCQYDKAFSIRCLINIMSKKDQYQALQKIHSLLKDKGIYIMSEAFYGGLENLNRARKLFGLPPLKEPRYNQYFREKEFEKFARKYFKILEIKKFSSLYYVGTRLFQYLALDHEPNEYDTDLHRFFGQFGFETKHSGDFGVQKIYVLKKK